MADGLGLEDAYGATIERIKTQGGEKSRLGDDCFDVDMPFGAATRSPGAMSGPGRGFWIGRLQCSLYTNSAKLLPRAGCDR